MREIKFRVWSTRHKSFDCDDFLIDSKTKSICGISITHEGFIYGDERDENGEYILMQYTGLKDKNGVEIYEGDIVETYNCKHALQVTFRNACFCIKTPNGGISELYELAPVANQAIEVIGNIYENPELLENEQ